MTSKLADSKSTAPTRSRKLELTAVAAFVAVNLLAPFVVGEMYPITISPMFCDQPTQYCTYEILDDSGNNLELEPFGLHLVYDGNPIGLGMGIEAKPQLHGFGEVPELAAVVEHVRTTAKLLNLKNQTIEIRQTFVCCNGTRPESETRIASVDLSEPSDP